MSNELSDTSRKFLNSYFHLMCREPSAEELAAFFEEQKIALIPAYTQMKHEAMLAEADMIVQEYQHRIDQQQQLFRRKIGAFIAGLLAVTQLFYFSFQWPSIVVLVLVFFYTLHIRRSHTHAQYIVLALEGLMRIFKDKFDIQCTDDDGQGTTQ